MVGVLAPCEIDEVLRRARRGDMPEALRQLEQSETDASLLQLCRECLSAEREDRPRHAGVVAERLAAYQAEVQERLRRAEVERAAAEVKAREERKRRRLTAALAALVLLVVIGVGGALWWRQWQIEKTDRAASNGLAQADLLADQARKDPLQTDKYQQALKVAEAAKQLAESGSTETQRRAAELVARLDQEEKAARKDRELLTALLDVRGPHEGPKYTSGANNTMMALAEPTADEQFAAAFRRWGMDIDGIPSDEAAKLLKARPPVVITEVIAALDEWVSERRRQKADWQRLADLAALLDNDPNSKRRELREIMARGHLPQEWALDVLSAALRPVPIPFPVPLGRDRMRLQQLAEQMNAATEPILGLLTLVRALGMVGEATRAEQLLRAAILARPKEVVLHHTLGQMLTTQQSPRWAEAVECYASARVARPDLGVNLAMALHNSGRDGEGLALLSRLVAESPRNPYMRFRKAHALTINGRQDEAATECREAIALDPKLGQPHNNLGNALRAKGRLDEAMAEYRQAIALDPKLAQPHYNLGHALRAKGQLDEALIEFRQAITLDPNFAKAHTSLGAIFCDRLRDYDRAIACFRQAIALDPKEAMPHNNLGTALIGKGQLDEALAEYRQAIALDPKLALAHKNFGNALRAKGHLDEAIAEYRLAITLDPNDAKVHTSLGAIFCDRLRDYDRAIACFRRAISLDPKGATAHYNLGNALRGKGQLGEALAEFRQTIALNPKYAEAHCNLGLLLLRQGRFDEAVARLKRGHELGSKQPGWRYSSAQWVRNAEGQAALARKLPTILTSAATSANPGEAVALASMCQQPYQKRYAASARLYADAFTSEPRLAPQHRYNAACSAALAAAGQGKDARLLPDKTAAMFRRWALGWLRDDLTAYAKFAEQHNPRVKQSIAQTLAHWRSDPDLTSIRDPQALERLPDAERAAWRALWRDVDERMKRVENSD